MFLRSIATYLVISVQGFMKTCIPVSYNMEQVIFRYLLCCTCLVMLSKKLNVNYVEQNV